MKIKNIILTIMLLLSFFLVGCKENKTTCTQGAIDLSHWAKSSNSILRLNGQWRLYWHQFVDPLNVDGDTENSQYSIIDLPASWTEHERMDSDGFGTLILDVDLGETDQLYGIKTIYMTSAFKVYANGEEIASNGTIGTTANSMEAEWKPVSGNFKSKDGKVQLVIHFSNFNHRMMVLKSIYFGTAEDINTLENNQRLSDLFIFGTIMIMGLYYLVKYKLHHRNRSLLYFSLLCFVAALRSFAVDERYLVRLFSGLEWEWFMKYTYVTIYLMVPLLLLFTEAAFEKFVNRAVVRCLIAITGCLIGFTLITQAKVFNQALIIYYALVLITLGYIIYILIRSIIAKEKGAPYVLIGFLCLALAGVNDIAYELDLINTKSLTSFGLLLFLFSQGHMMAFRFPQEYE